MMVMYLNPLYLITVNNMSKFLGDPAVIFYNLENLYGNKINQITPENPLSVFNMYHFDVQGNDIYIMARDEFIARIALLDLGYGIIK